MALTPGTVLVYREREVLTNTELGSVGDRIIDAESRQL